MSSKPAQQGFTLIEIIVGMVVLAVALTLITSIIVPTARQSVSPVFQVRAAELGQSLLNDIMSKSFDVHSDRRGGRVRCGEEGAAECEPIIGCPPPMQRDEMTNVSDYHCLDMTRAEQALRPGLAARYVGYNLNVDVCYSDAAGHCVTDATQTTNFKRVWVQVTTPEGQDLDFASVRGNF